MWLVLTVKKTSR